MSESETQPERLRPLSEKNAEAIEAEMRRMEADPSTTLRAMRLFMQAPMPCGHATGNLLTCPTPPFGCVVCNDEHRLLEAPPNYVAVLKFNAERAMAKCELGPHDDPGYCGKCGWAPAMLWLTQELARLTGEVARLERRLERSMTHADEREYRAELERLTGEVALLRTKLENQAFTAALHADIAADEKRDAEARATAHRETIALAVETQAALERENVSLRERILLLEVSDATNARQWQTRAEHAEAELARLEASRARYESDVIAAVGEREEEIGKRIAAEAEVARVTQELRDLQAQTWLSDCSEFHPASYIEDELRERDWTRQDLARLMVVELEKETEIAKATLMLDLYLGVGWKNPQMRIGENTAKDIARVFGCSAEMFLNLETAWRERVQAGRQPAALPRDGTG